MSISLANADRVIPMLNEWNGLAGFFVVLFCILVLIFYVDFVLNKYG